MKLKVVAFVAVLFFFQTTLGFAVSGNIKWYSYNEGMDLVKKEKKKVFIHFWAEWCPSCKKMEKETFKDSSVIAYLNKNFISIKVNSDRENALSSEFGVRGVPDNWFVSEDNEAISNLPGYIPTKMFLPILKFIQTDSYKRMTFNKFMREM